MAWRRQLDCSRKGRKERQAVHRLRRPAPPRPGSPGALSAGNSRWSRTLESMIVPRMNGRMSRWLMTTSHASAPTARSAPSGSNRLAPPPGAHCARPIAQEVAARVRQTLSSPDCTTTEQAFRARRLVYSAGTSRWKPAGCACRSRWSPHVPGCERLPGISAARARARCRSWIANARWQRRNGNGA
jgi:hypothetical protein